MLGRWMRNYVVAPDYPGATHLTVHAEDGVAIHALRLDGPVDCGVTVMIVPGFGQWARHAKIVEFAYAMASQANVIVVELRGHGRSGGESRMGAVERRDVAAAAALVSADETFVLIGISMGGAASIGFAGTTTSRRPDALVSISGPAWWTWAVPTNKADRARYDANTWLMRVGMRMFMRARVGTFSATDWIDPVSVIAALRGTPIALVHDRRDHYFGADQVEALARAGGDNVEVWWREGGHATDLLNNDLYDALARFVASAHGRRTTESRGPHVP